MLGQGWRNGRDDTRVPTPAYISGYNIYRVIEYNQSVAGTVAFTCSVNLGSQERKLETKSKLTELCLCLSLCSSSPLHPFPSNYRPVSLSLFLSVISSLSSLSPLFPILLYVQFQSICGMSFRIIAFFMVHHSFIEPFFVTNSKVYSLGRFIYLTTNIFLFQKENWYSMYVWLLSQV